MACKNSSRSFEIQPIKTARTWLMKNGHKNLIKYKNDSRINKNLSDDKKNESRTKHVDLAQKTF